jgi:hypothetical protein
MILCVSNGELRYIPIPGETCKQCGKQVYRVEAWVPVAEQMEPVKKTVEERHCQTIGCI